MEYGFEKTSYCFQYIAGFCEEDGTHDNLVHPKMEAIQSLRESFSKKPCKNNEKCANDHCLFHHTSLKKTIKPLVKLPKKNKETVPGLDEFPALERVKEKPVKTLDDHIVPKDDHIAPKDDHIMPKDYHVAPISDIVVFSSSIKEKAKELQTRLGCSRNDENFLKAMEILAEFVATKIQIPKSILEDIKSRPIHLISSKSHSATAFFLLNKNQIYENVLDFRCQKVQDISSLLVEFSNYLRAKNYETVWLFFDKNLSQDIIFSKFIELELDFMIGSENNEAKGYWIKF